MGAKVSLPCGGKPNNGDEIDSKKAEKASNSIDKRDESVVSQDGITLLQPSPASSPTNGSTAKNPVNLDSSTNGAQNATTALDNSTENLEAKNLPSGGANVISGTNAVETGRIEAIPKSPVAQKPSQQDGNNLASIGEDKEDDTANNLVGTNRNGVRKLGPPVSPAASNPPAQKFKSDEDVLASLKAEKEKDTKGFGETLGLNDPHKRAPENIRKQLSTEKPNSWMPFVSSMHLRPTKLTKEEVNTK